MFTFETVEAIGFLLLIVLLSLMVIVSQRYCTIREWEIEKEREEMKNG